MSNLREFLNTLEQSEQEEPLDPFDKENDNYFIETIVECNDGVVWKDPNIDEHRWYSLQKVVVEYRGRFIMYDEYIIQGDNSMEDMDLGYRLDDFKLVEKKVKTVEVTYYE